MLCIIIMERLHVKKCLSIPSLLFCVYRQIFIIRHYKNGGILFHSANSMTIHSQCGVVETKNFLSKILNWKNIYDFFTVRARPNKKSLEMLHSQFILSFFYCIHRSTLLRGGWIWKMKLRPFSLTYAFALWNFVEKKYEVILDLRGVEG